MWGPLLLTYHRSLSSAGIPNQGRGHALVPAAVMGSINYYYNQFLPRESPFINIMCEEYGSCFVYLLLH